ncbi:MAG: YqaA family protein [bacterium]
MEKSAPPSSHSPSPREQTFWGKTAQGLLTLWEHARQAWMRFADSSQHAWWFPLLLAVVVAFDALVVILPGDTMVALAVLSNPSRWRRIAVVSAIGSMLGSFVLFLLIHRYGVRILEHFTHSGLSLPRWQSARDFFRHYGLFSLALGSILPGGTWPPVVMAGLSTNRWVAVLGWLLVGRLTRFLLLSFGIREGWAVFQVVKKEAKDGRKGLAETPSSDTGDRPDLP